MEDALVQLVTLSKEGEADSLNPCFNGRCTRTRRRMRQNLTYPLVLILVLMEDALVR